MKKRFSKLAALVLSLVMALSLAAPAWADYGYSPLNTDPEWIAWRDSWLASHPEEHAAFDPDLWFEQHYEYYDSQAEFMEEYGIATREEFQAHMVQDWLEGIQYSAKLYPAAEEYAQAHPEEYAAFDADAWAEQSWYTDAQGYMTMWQVDEATFRKDMWSEYVEELLGTQELEQKIAQFKADWPQECAAFDPYAYFEENYSWSWFDSPQDYMDMMGQTEEEFRQDMFLEWMDGFLSMLQAKEQLGGSSKGVNVMVDGQCVPFPDAQPEISGGRTMAPLRAIMEALGAEVDYRGEDDIRCTVGGVQYTFAVGSTAVDLRYAEYDGEGGAPDMEGLIMDCAPYVKNGRIYVPVRFFAVAFGYEVLWDQEYQTAVLLDRQGLIGSIDKKFTLASRLLYAASGADQVKEGQSLEQSVRFDLDATLFDTLHGDSRIPADLSATALTSGKAVELHLSGDLSSLVDLLDSGDYLDLDSQALAQLRTDLKTFSLDGILNLEVGAVYFRCPALARLGFELEDPEAWVALPADLSLLSDLSFSGQSQPASIGQIAVDAETGSPFWCWDNALKGAEELEGYIGDSQFTRSGNTYTLSLQETDHSWDGEQTYAFKLTITPAGEKSCSYTIAFDLTGDDMVVDMDLAGASGKAELTLSLHMKNVLKLTLKGASRISGSDKAPLSQPPKGSKIQFPAGPTGSGRL